MNSEAFSRVYKWVIKKGWNITDRKQVYIVKGPGITENGGVSAYPINVTCLTRKEADTYRKEYIDRAKKILCS